MAKRDVSEQDFWPALSRLMQSVTAGDAENARRALMDADAAAALAAPHLVEARTALAARLSGVYRFADPNPVSGRGPATLPGGVSLVSCCRNRNDNLLKALPTWIALSAISEIVIVDWTSAAPVRADLVRHGFDDPRIRIVRVEDEPCWVLSLAYNAGFKHARFDRILKVDADVQLAPDFFAKNRLNPEKFIAGNWRKLASGQSYLNGLFYAWRKDINEIAGFNEYITTYGWDDDDLYARLADRGLERKDLAPGTASHLPHDDTARTDRTPPPAGARAHETLPTDTMFLTRRNRQIANLMPTWDPKRPSAAYKVLSDGPADIIARRVQSPVEPTPAAVEREAFLTAARELLAWRSGDIAYTLDHDRVEALLASRAWADITLADIIGALSVGASHVAPGIRWLFVDARGADARAAADFWQRIGGAAADRRLTPLWFGEAPPGYRGALADSHTPLPPATAIDADGLTVATPLDGSAFTISVEKRGADKAAPPRAIARRDRVFVDGRHGLGNRLRAIGSGAAIARATDRELVIVWEPDAHCDCRFSDLFDYVGAVVEQSFHDDLGAKNLNVINYMEAEGGNRKGASVELAAGADVYLRSAFVFNHPASSWNSENIFIRSLKPRSDIVELINSARSPNDVSVHIRMAGGAAYEHLPWEAPSNWSSASHDLVAHWRRESHYSKFMTRLDELISRQDVRRIFLAADRTETYKIMQARYGDALAMLKRPVDDRSVEQLRYALADAILLSRSPRLLGSTWSSFSELARRLAATPMTVEMSGVDF